MLRYRLIVALLLLGLPLAAVSAGGETCVDRDGDGFCGDDFDPPSDCNDDAPDVQPGMPESCNAVDDDCDGVVDDSTDCAAPCGSLEPFGRRFATAASADDVVALAWTGSAYGLFWNRDDGLWFKRFTERSSDPAVRVLDEPVEWLSVVWTGSRYALLHYRNGVVLRRYVDPDGTLVGLPAEVLRGDQLRDVSAAWNGRELAVNVARRRIETSVSFWEQHLVLLDLDGRVQSDASFDFELRSLRLALAWADGEYVRAITRQYTALCGTGVLLLYNTAEGLYDRSASFDSATFSCGSLGGMVWTGDRLALTATLEGPGERNLLAFPRGGWLTQQVTLPPGEPGAFLVWTGHVFATTFWGTAGAAVTLFDASGRVLGTPPLISGNRPDALVWTGRGFGIAWKHAPRGEVRFQRLTCRPRIRER